MEAMARRLDFGITARGTLLCVSALAAALLSRGLWAQSAIEWKSAEGRVYSALVSPPRPKPGDLVLVELRLEGMIASSAKLLELDLDPGIEIEAESLRPFTPAGSAAGGAAGGAASSGTLLRLELRVQKEGALGIRALKIASGPTRAEFGPLALVPAEAESGGREGRSDWRWVLPERAYRYEAFGLRLEPIGGEAASSSAAGAGAESPPAASFAPPLGASVEASGKLSWTAVAFEEGRLELPEARIGSGSSGGAAAAASLAILPLPRGLETSRAIGSFKLSLVEESSPRGGGVFRARLVLEGQGNFPLLELPEPELRLDGEALPPSAWSARRIDEYRPEGSGYRGRSSLELELGPPRSGLLRLGFPSFAVLDPRAGVTRLEVPVLERRVEAAARGAVSRESEGSSQTKPASPGRLASPDWGAGMKEPATLWARGEEGKALALLYGKLRRSAPFSRQEREARAAAVSASAFLGTSPPILDALPPPCFFAIAASLATIAGLSLFITARLRGRKAGAAPGAPLLLALVLIMLLLASASERRGRCAVVWADSLRAVPSELSELSVPVAKGSTARLRGRSGNFVGLALSDGVEGWAPSGSIYFY
jgi:hypothetical protein